MPAPGLDVNVLRAECADLRRRMEQGERTAAVMSRILSALVEKAGGAVSISAESWEAMAGRTCTIVREDGLSSIVVTLLPPTGEGTATTHAEPPAPTEPEVETQWKPRIVG